MCLPSAPKTEAAKPMQELKQPEPLVRPKNKKGNAMIGSTLLTGPSGLGGAAAAQTGMTNLLGS